MEVKKKKSYDVVGKDHDEAAATAVSVLFQWWLQCGWCEVWFKGPRKSSEEAVPL